MNIKMKFRHIPLFVLALASLMAAAALASAGAPQERPAGATAKWTVMAFINADNNLDSCGVEDVQEMERAGAASGVNVVVEIDRLGLPARRYSVGEAAAGATADDWGLRSKMMAELGEVDMGDYNELVGFARWAMENYPAENYMLVVWNHGDGWRKKAAGAAQALRGISYDDQSGNHITTGQLGLAMSAIRSFAGRPLDILGMDACLMQMAEVAFEVRENVRYVCASEETEPADGWPYDLILTPLYRNPAMDAETLAKLVPQAYAQYYYSHPPAGGIDGTTQSAIDCSRLGEFYGAVDELAAVLIETMSSDAEVRRAVDTAVSSAQRFYYRDHLDAGDLFWFIRENTKNEKVVQACQKALAVYRRAVLASRYTGEPMKDATGMAIYFPKKGFIPSYSDLEFSSGRWDEMVRLFQASDRP